MNRHAVTLKAKALTHKVTKINDFTWDVTSGKSGNTYQIIRYGNAFQCSCDWGFWHPNTCECSHSISVRKSAAAETRILISAWGTSEDALRQHRPIVAANDGLLFTARKSMAAA